MHPLHKEDPLVSEVAKVLSESPSWRNMERSDVPNVSYIHGVAAVLPTTTPLQDVVSVRDVLSAYLENTHGDAFWKTAIPKLPSGKKTEVWLTKESDDEARLSSTDIKKMTDVLTSALGEPGPTNKHRISAYIAR